jgi:hypothetical protein
MDPRDTLIAILVQRLGGDITVNAGEFDAVTESGKDLRVWQDLGTLQYRLQVVATDASIVPEWYRQGRAKLYAAQARVVAQQAAAPAEPTAG